MSQQNMIYAGLGLMVLYYMTRPSSTAFRRGYAGAYHI